MPGCDCARCVGLCRQRHCAVPLGDVQQGKEGDKEHSVNTVRTLVDQLIDLGMLLRDIDLDDRHAARLWLAEESTQRLAAGHQARAEVTAR